MTANLTLPLLMMQKKAKGRAMVVVFVAVFLLHSLLCFDFESSLSFGADAFFFQRQNNVYLTPRTKATEATPTILSTVTSSTASTHSSKIKFLQSLDDPMSFNSANKERDERINNMIKENPTIKPGSATSFMPFAEGTWRIIYAPHIYTMGRLFQGSFDPVLYILNADGTMSSHAKYNFPIIGSGWLSVSGTYGSQDENNVCRVDFDKTWIKQIIPDKEEQQQQQSSSSSTYYECLEDVPPSPLKDMIQALGKLFFIDAVSIFPVSYLDEDTIVFDFELLGTRICARKIISPPDKR